ncbi:MAG: nucleotidyltransferase family protein [archaeon]
MNSREEKLLIELLKEKDTKDAYKNINWKTFIELCYYHRITGFVSKKINKDLAPKKFLEELQETNKKIVLKNVVLNKEMISLFAELERKKIDVIALKGMALNQLLYPESFSRVSSDIDFLIKEKDYPKIKKVMKEKKFMSASASLWEKMPSFLRNLLFGPFYQNYQHFPAMTKKVNGFNCILEPHRKLFFPVNCFSIDLDEVWKNSRKIKSIQIPGNEDLTIIAVLSTVYQHAFYGMFEALVDVKNLLPKINYKKLKEKTIKYNAIEPMIYFNELLKEVFDEEMGGIKELEKNSDKKRLSYLRKNSLEKTVKIKNHLFYNFRKTKTRFYWTRNLQEKIRAVFFVFIMPILWKTKTNAG